MKWIVGTWFERSTGIFEVIERSWDGHCVVQDRLGKTYPVHEQRLEQAYQEGKVYNHRVNEMGLGIYLEDGVVKKIKKHKS